MQTLQSPQTKTDFSEGDRVTYSHRLTSRVEKGIVKSVHDEDPSLVFVVYRCGGNWSNFRNYTGVLTHRDDLKMGWEL